MGKMSDTKDLTYSDVAEHTTKKDLFVVIHDKVYNASSFVDEHPYVPLLLKQTTLSPAVTQTATSGGKDWPAR